MNLDSPDHYADQLSDENKKLRKRIAALEAELGVEKRRLFTANAAAANYAEENARLMAVVAEKDEKIKAIVALSISSGDTYAQILAQCHYIARDAIALTPTHLKARIDAERNVIEAAKAVDLSEFATENFSVREADQMQVLWDAIAALEKAGK